MAPVETVDIAWLLVSAVLVLFMQAGLTALESGLVRSKNSANVAIKNFVNFLVAASLFWLFGLAVMFGEDTGGLFGRSLFMFDSTPTRAGSEASVPSRRERRTDAARYRHALPQLESGVFLGDGGIGTSLVFDQGIGLPDFAAFPLLATAAGRDALDRYYDAYARIAGRDGVGVVLGAATWRANSDWGIRLSYDAAALAEANRVSVRQLVGVRRRHETSSTPVVISGIIGPRGDGYRPAHRRMTVDAAIRYHVPQARAFAASEADLLTATTMTYPAEAIGIAEAARRVEMPVVLSFTLGRDGSLPSGHTLREAIESADEATDGYPAYYMINCAHPDHFAGVLEPGAAWTRRIRGLRSNASRKSHTQLDRAAELDAGDPTELADLYQNLHTQHPHLVVLGGCCGTNHRHIDAISRRVRPDRRLDTPAA